MSVDVGDLAPDFSLRDQNNEVVTLSALRGERAVVLVFYPLAFTNVCQGELCTLRDEIADFDNDDVTTLAVSVDSVFSHKVWADREGYAFRLLSDFWPHGEVARAYGVLDEQLGVAVRGTFVIDKAGVVRHKVVNAIPDARDTDEYRKVLANL